MQKYDPKTYFKRMKTPAKSIEELEPLKAETKFYMMILFGVGVVFGILAGIIEIAALNALFTIVGVAGLMAGIYFWLVLYAFDRVEKRLKNLTCDKCGASLDDISCAKWEEIERRWQDSNDKNQAVSRLYVTVEITCTCPECGEVKTFRETLCSGKIRVTSMSVRDTLVSTDKIVEDYFNGLIHA